MRFRDENAAHRPILDEEQRPGGPEHGPARPGDRHEPSTLTALQRSAGNRAVAGLLRPSVQRCGSTEHADDGRESELTSGQGVEGIVDEAPLISEQSVQRTVAGRQPVQRVATFATGTVHETNSLANTVVNGVPVGATTPVLNGTVTSTGGQLQSALAKPTLTTAAASAGGFDSEVDTIPTNTGSFDETVLSAGPWRLATTKAFFHGRFPGVAGCGGAGNTRLRAFGDPTDAAMQAANRRHEDRHASDIRAAFNAIVVPWDQKLTAAKVAGTKFHGATAADAEAALWASMGGTPMEIANAFINRLVSDSNAFHATATGGPVRQSTARRPGARDNCSISWVFMVNPS
jgi:hypothetical protein